MKQNRFRIVAVVVALLAFGGVSPAAADTDPFPGVAQGAEIPGTRVSGDVAIDCPAGSGRGIEVNASTGGTASYCVKTWQSQATVDAWAAYRTAVDTAQAAALAQSQAWNAANPGQQKCFQWGPFTDPNGGTSSGGVCANPVAAPAGAVVDTPTLSSPAVSESVTPVVASTPVVESVTPVATPTAAPVVAAAAPVTTGLGGYAVVHPDGHVCGVIVATSTDPFGNGGTMPQEYMGCPAGARIVFQSAPSADGNVAGWHGAEVTLSGNTYTLPGGSTLANGVVSDPNGRTWNSGTGQTITPGAVDTRTVLVDSRTATIDSSTALAAPIVSGDSATAVAIASAPAPVANLDSIPEVEPEVEASNTVDATVIGGKTKIEVSTEWVSTRLNVVATKKGSKKKYSYKVTTDDAGNVVFKSSINLKGFTVVLYKGSEELDRTIV